MSVHDKLRVKRLDHTATLEELARLQGELDSLVGGPDYRVRKAHLEQRIHIEQQTAQRIAQEIQQLTQSTQTSLF